jgi:hypothetical protein
MSSRGSRSSWDHWSRSVNSRIHPSILHWSSTGRDSLRRRPSTGRTLATSSPSPTKTENSRVRRVSKRIRSTGLCTVYIEAGLRVRISTATISAATNKARRNRPSRFHAKRQSPYTHKTNICRTPFHDGHAHARTAGAGAATADATSASTSVDDLTIATKELVPETQVILANKTNKTMWNDKHLPLRIPTISTHSHPLTTPGPRMPYLHSALD